MASKKARKTNKQSPINNNVQKLTATAKNINQQVVATASEIVDGVVENSKKWSAAAVETAKNRIDTLDVTAGFGQLKSITKNANDFALTTAEDVVEVAIKNGEKWQGLSEKAVKGSLQLAERQQDMVFDTLESLKGQVIKSASRFRTIFSKN